MRKLLFEVITSWQVIATTIVLIIYLFVVKYVARIYHRTKKPPAMPKAKPQKAEAPVTSENDDLGIE